MHQTRLFLPQVASDQANQLIRHRGDKEEKIENVKEEKGLLSLQITTKVAVTALTEIVETFVVFSLRKSSN